jgi:hypothetical protein
VTIRRAPNSSATRLTTRNGVAAILVLICLSFATVVATLLIQAALAERTYANRIALTYQTDWLVEAGIDRAAAQIAQSSSYKGETWPVTFPTGDRQSNAVVHIDIQRTADSQTRLVRVNAEIRGEGASQFESHKEIHLSVNRPAQARSGRS